MKNTFLFIFLALSVDIALALPAGFIAIHDIAPDIIEDLRYASSNNFMGRQAQGYESARCILSKEAAYKLAAIEIKAQSMGYHLKVYDCYRPQKAVNDFYAWSQDPTDQKMKNQFYPREDKSTLFANGYISQTSGHTRGSTVDLTLIKANKQTHIPALGHCYSKNKPYQDDASINTGTRFDCLDESANFFYSKVTKQQKRNRLLLRTLMIDGGFYPYDKEWWHFTLKDEPWPQTYFNFPMQ